MARVDDAETATEILTETTRYLRKVERATEQLAVVLDAYVTDEAAFAASVADLQDLESECDAVVGDLRSLVGSSMDPNFSGLYLYSGALVEFYETTDTVVNEAERFATELAAMEPTLPEEIRDDMDRMAEFANEATVHLSRAGTTQFRTLADPDRSGEISRETEQVRALETRCDDVKYRVLEHAFASLSPAEALLVRALANRLDAVTNAVEDAADRLAYLDQHAR